MKATLEIKSIFGKVLFTYKASKKNCTIKNALHKAIKSGSNLSYSNLRDSDLSGSDLSGSNLRGSDLRGSNLSDSNLSYSNLSYSNLSYSNLSYSNLRGSNLRGSNLRGSNLSYSNLSYSNLSYSNLTKYIKNPIHMLLDQPGKIRAYKLINKNDEGYWYPGVKYLIGKSVEVKDANTDLQIDCAEGINLASLDWCLINWRNDLRIIICEFTTKDIACIPENSDGKFRVFRCKVVGEKNLADLGWPNKKVSK